MDLAPLFLDNCSYPHFWSRQSYIRVHVMDIYHSQKQIEMVESMKKSGGNKLRKSFITQSSPMEFVRQLISDT
ncbi:unnamed protein product [Prunus armeniaca]|uniref:Uncharacterized protein n=1 Tax=Prunus armeniaca TaxID=36596 RepID=A0A6J5XXD7_PRUAR|nr:unnamed protein product [Prunus armeniaca]